MAEAKQNQLTEQDIPREALEELQAELEAEAAEADYELRSEALSQAVACAAPGEPEAATLKRADAFVNWLAGE